MSNTIDRATFESICAGNVPWEIGKPHEQFIVGVSGGALVAAHALRPRVRSQRGVTPQDVPKEGSTNRCNT